MREEANTAPRGTDRAGEKGAHAEGAFSEGVELVEGRGEEGFVAWKGEEGEEESEEFGHGREGAEVEG